MSPGPVPGLACAAVSIDVPDPEDRKLLLLARSSGTRSGGGDGAAVRDLDGRTYAAGAVELPHLRLSALALATAMAVSSGAKGLEAAAVATNTPHVAGADLAIVADLGGGGVPVWRGDRAGRALGRAST